MHQAPGKGVLCIVSVVFLLGYTVVRVSFHETLVLVIHVYARLCVYKLLYTHASPMCLCRVYCVQNVNFYSKTGSTKFQKAMDRIWNGDG